MSDDYHNFFGYDCQHGVTTIPKAVKRAFAQA